MPASVVTTMAILDTTQYYSITEFPDKFKSWSGSSEKGIQSRPVTPKHGGTNSTANTVVSRGNSHSMWTLPVKLVI